MYCRLQTSSLDACVEPLYISLAISSQGEAVSPCKETVNSGRPRATVPFQALVLRAMPARRKTEAVRPQTPSHRRYHISNSALRLDAKKQH